MSSTTAMKMAQAIASTFDRLEARKVVQLMASMDSSAQGVLAAVYHSLLEGEEVEVENPCKVFVPVTGRTKLDPDRYYIKDGMRKLSVVAFCRPAAIEGWAYYVGLGGEEYQINEFKLYRKGGWVK